MCRNFSRKNKNKKKLIFSIKTIIECRNCGKDRKRLTFDQLSEIDKVRWTSTGLAVSTEYYLHCYSCKELSAISKTLDF